MRIQHATHEEVCGFAETESLCAFLQGQLQGKLCGLLVKNYNSLIRFVASDSQLLTIYFSLEFLEVIHVLLLLEWSLWWLDGV